jgi:hypothetical protein
MKIISKKKLKSFYKAFESIGCFKAGNNCWDDVFVEKMSSDQANKAISNSPMFTIGTEKLGNKLCSNWYVTPLNNANLMTIDLCNQFCLANGFNFMGLT